MVLSFAYYIYRFLYACGGTCATVTRYSYSHNSERAVNLPHRQRPYAGGAISIHPNPSVNTHTHTLNVFRVSGPAPLILPSPKESCRAPTRVQA